MGVVCGGFDGSDGGRKLERAEEGQTMIIGAPSGALLVLPPRWAGWRGCAGGTAAWVMGPLGPAAGMALVWWSPSSSAPFRRRCRRGIVRGAAPDLRGGRRRRPFRWPCRWPHRPWAVSFSCGSRSALGPEALGSGDGPRRLGSRGGRAPLAAGGSAGRVSGASRGSAGLVVGDAGEFGLGVGVAFLVGAYPFVAVVGGVQFVPLVGVWVIP